MVANITFQRVAGGRTEGGAGEEPRSQGLTGAHSPTFQVGHTFPNYFTVELQQGEKIKLRIFSNFQCIS